MSGGGLVATDYFTTRSGNWWPIEVILGGSFQGHVAYTLSINFYKFLLVKPSLKPVLFHCGSSSFSPYTLQGQSDTSVALYSVFFSERARVRYSHRICATSRVHTETASGQFEARGSNWSATGVLHGNKNVESGSLACRNIETAAEVLVCASVS